MIPALSAVYDELVRRAAGPPNDAPSKKLRRQFSLRTGSFQDDHPSAAARLSAAWEDVLVRGRMAEQLREGFEDSSERALVDLVLRAQRGVYEVRTQPTVLLGDLCRGGEFLLLKRDDVARSAPTLMQDGASVFVGRIVGAGDGCSVLPGAVWLPGEAVPLLGPIMIEAKKRLMDVDDVADALLRMDYQYATLARIRAHGAFRPDALL